MDLMKELTADDMPNEDMRFIYDELGREVAIRILQLFAGTTIIVPINYLKVLQRRLVEQHRSHMSVKDMARRFSMNENTVRKYLKDMQERRRQQILFEEE